MKSRFLLSGVQVDMIKAFIENEPFKAIEYGLYKGVLNDILNKQNLGNSDKSLEEDVEIVASHFI